MRCSGRERSVERATLDRDAPRISSCTTRRTSASATRLYPGHAGAARPLRRRRAGRFAVCTNKPERHVAPAARASSAWRRASPPSAAATASPTRKPDPAHLLDTIASGGGRATRIASWSEIRAPTSTPRAPPASPFVGVTFGYTPVPMADLAPDLLIDSFDELTPEVAGAAARDAGRARPRLAAAPAAPIALISGECAEPIDRGRRAVSSAGEHTLHTRGVTGSIPVPPTIISRAYLEFCGRGHISGNPRNVMTPHTISQTCASSL